MGTSPHRVRRSRGRSSIYRIAITRRRCAFYKIVCQDVLVIHSWNDPRSISQVMERNGLDVLLPLMNPPGKGLTKPWVGYMFDLQHRVHPEFSSQETITSRNDRFSRLVKEAKVIIVNSRTVGEEAQRYFPSEITNYVVLPFTPKTPREWFDEASISKMKEKYHLTRDTS